MKTLKITDYNMPALIENKLCNSGERLTNDIDIPGWQPALLGERLQIPVYVSPIMEYNNECPEAFSGDYTEKIVQYRHEYKRYVLSILIQKSF